MFFYIIFDLCMAVIFFIFGITFYKSNGKAAKFLTGYNTKSNEERKKYNENELCRVYGKRMMIWALPFIFGSIVDFQFAGIGCLAAWGIWFILFILLLADRHKREQ